MGERGIRRRRRVGVLLALLAAGFAALVIAPGIVPDGTPFALPFDAVLPWLGAPIALVILAALVRRAWLGTLAGIAAAVVWAVAFLPGILPLTPATAGGGERVSVLSQNLRGAAGDPESTARAALDRSPDLIAFQELDAASRAPVAAVLDEAYPHSVAVGTLGLWSRFPIDDLEPLDLGLGWYRAMRADLASPEGPIRIYAVHAASARIFSHEQRDEMLTELADLVRDDPSGRVVALGDFNAGSEDRVLAPLLDEVREPNQTSGGFGFSWPRRFPFVRLDHVLVRGFEATDAETVRLGDSDHLAVTAELLPGGRE